MKPRIGLILGDPNGIGAEIVAKLLRQSAVVAQAKIIVIGDHKVYRLGAGRPAYQPTCLASLKLIRLTPLNPVLSSWTGPASPQKISAWDKRRRQLVAQFYKRSPWPWTWRKRGNSKRFVSPRSTSRPYTWRAAPTRTNFISSPLTWKSVAPAVS